MYRKLLMLAALTLCSFAAACNTGPVGLASTPAEIADSTKLDEQAALGAEVLYTTASTFGNSLSRVGAIDRARFQALDRAAYASLQVVRSAYKAGNSADFVTALTNLNTTVAQIRDLKGK